MQKWIESENVSEELKSLIKSYDDKQLEKAFKTKIEFGTAGMRGTMGVGYGYINENIINWATIGYAKYLKNNFEKPKVVIAYDNRLNSDIFANIVANVFTNYEIETLLFHQLTSTPQLSYTIRTSNACGGVNITASHNPKSDNGYKLYDSTGCQYLPEEVDKIKTYMDDIKDPIDVAVFKEVKSEYLTIYDNDNDYAEYVSTLTTNDQSKYEKILITPLHGCSSVIIPTINNLVKFENIFYVEDQMINDPNFTTAPSPNPDTKSSYDFALKHNDNECNYILANDPDADRVGLYDVINDKLLTGNQIATLLMQYFIDTKQYTEQQVIITSKVSSMLPIEIAKKHNLKTIVTLTGFKWIGNLMDDNNFLFGYEESNGYLTHVGARDKDGIAATFKIIEMINYYYNKGLTLADKLELIYEEYNYYLESQTSIFVDNNSIVEEVISKITLDTFEGISSIENYNTLEILSKESIERIDLPKNNMLKVNFNDESWFAIRPSGTEPKIKIYYNIISDNVLTAKEKLNTLENGVNSLFNK